MSFIYYCFYYNYYKAMIVLSVYRKVSTQHTDSTDVVRITSFSVFNRIMYPHRINYRINILYSDILYFDVRITSFRMFYRIMYPLRINY